MKRILTVVSICVAAFVGSTLANAQKLPYQDETLPIEKRVDDLLGRMTVDEKIDLMRATSPANERLGIAKYYHGNEALHGVVRPGNFTVFPQAIGLAASWDPDLLYKVTTAISDEARARWNELGEGKLQKNQFSDLLTFWSPTINMARDPRWGRTPETYGEDPFLTGEMGTAFVKGLQGNDPRYLKVVSTPKHFAANNEEHNRFECDAEISEKQLREYYLPGYEALIRRGKAASIMASYNAINGIPSSANPWLLTKVLRDDWGFEGYVVSDCGGPSTLVEDHHYVAKKETAAALCLLSGLDLECGDNYYIEPLKKAYKLGMVKDEDIDRAARRILTARMRLGIFDSGKDNPYTKISPDVIGSEEHQALALEMAKEAIVLLKNEKNMLPLKKGKVRSVAVVGINAASCEFGDYSGTPASTPVSILDGIKTAAAKEKIKVNFAPWKTAADGMEMIAPEFFPNGLKAEYYSGTELKGQAKTRTDQWINFEPNNQAPDPFLPASPLSIRWTGTLKPSVSGEYEFSFTSDDGCRLWIDGKLVIDAWGGHQVRSDNVKINLEAGKEYQLKAEYWNNLDYAVAKLSWRPPVLDGQGRIALYGKAGEMAAKSDVVIAVMGINKTIEREGKDRDYLTLPADQQEFLQELYHINKNIVLVLVAGSSLSILWEDKNLPAIVNAWYPGEKGGTAVADVLFGKYNPAGRLPLTYYNRIEDLPPFDDYDITKRTYKYFEGDVLYPFGYGLSYSTFRYSNLKVEDKGENVEVSFTLKNIGKYDGDEVAQVYTRLPEYEGKAPIKELRGFKRVHLKKGETKTVTIPVRREDLRYWSESQGKFIIPEGLPEVMVGASSADIRLKTE
ncbi:MAG: glycoside hydrolase family 3 C-terminal domain-containing protein [Bacteroidales bacterium]|nr:glycoside hydrolase family 3 C-terminal domain-containing protein [Bacteroidales bacterium]